MGYRMTCIESKFRIRAEQRAPAFEALKHAALAEGANDRHEIRSARFLPALVAAFCWRVKVIDVEGSLPSDITGISFEGEKSGEEDLLFKALAPYVEAGSVVEMLGEGGERWRYVFDGQSVRIQRATIVWTDEAGA